MHLINERTTAFMEREKPKVDEVGSGRLDGVVDANASKLVLRLEQAAQACAPVREG